MLALPILQLSILITQTSIYLRDLGGVGVVSLFRDQMVVFFPTQSHSSINGQTYNSGPDCSKVLIWRPVGWLLTWSFYQSDFKNSGKD